MTTQPKLDPLSIIQRASAVLRTEAESITDLLPRIDETFVRACEILLNCGGRVIVTGMGKSGHIGSKLAATLASTGTASFFVHPGEASHGDLGMITRDDVVLALSNSGETAEILTILPMLKRLSIPLITLTGNTDSTLAKEATVNLDITVKEEACPLGLAPTSSTTASLAMGDAIAVALLEHRGFTREDFSLSHPGGLLGRRLLVRVKDLMHSGSELPRVNQDANISEALIEMSRKGLGMTLVVDQQNKHVGIFTDGDLRRALGREIDIHQTSVHSVMTTGGISVHHDSLAAESIKLMQDNQVTSLLSVDDEHTLVGIITMHDCLKAGIV